MGESQSVVTNIRKGNINAIRQLDTVDGNLKYYAIFYNQYEILEHLLARYQNNNIDYSYVKMALLSENYRCLKLLFDHRIEEIGGHVGKVLIDEDISDTMIVFIINYLTNKLLDIKKQNPSEYLLNVLTEPLTPLFSAIMSKILRYKLSRIKKYFEYCQNLFKIRGQIKPFDDDFLMSIMYVSYISSNIETVRYVARRYKFLVKFYNIDSREKALKGYNVENENYLDFLLVLDEIEDNEMFDINVFIYEVRKYCY